VLGGYLSIYRFGPVPPKGVGDQWVWKKTNFQKFVGYLKKTVLFTWAAKSFTRYACIKDLKQVGTAAL